MRRQWIIVPCLLVGAALSLAGGQAPEAAYTADFGFKSSDTLLPSGDNQYLSLTPGFFSRFEGEDDGQASVVEHTVLQQTKQVRFQASDGPKTVKTRVVEEREWTNGELTQISYNFYACCPTTGNIYQFGEKSTQYQHGTVIGHDGSWMAGKNDAKPALFMPGYFLIGSRYYQELAPGVAMGRAENVAMDLTYETPAGTFTSCVSVRETTPLEPDEEVLKIYAPGVGLIKDGHMSLVEYHR